MARNLGVPYTDKPPYYFISYNSEDEARVRKYAAKLSEHKVPMWYDHGIKVGNEFEIEIAEKIDNCLAVIMFLSRNIFSKGSSYVHKEFELATEYSEKPVFVVMLDEIKKPEVPIRFRSWWTEVSKLQCVNAYECATEELCAQKLIESADITILSENQVSSSVNVKQQINKTERIVYDNGDVYEGDLVNGVLNGKGKYIWKNGEVYEGDYLNGKRTGRGKYIYANGEVYEGDWLNGRRTGRGKYIYANGEVYEGDFVNGELNGRGKYIWPNGDVYEGDYLNGKRNGKGKYIWKNGDVYEGDYLNGKRTGRGKYTYADGRVKEGIFENGVFKG